MAYSRIKHERRESEKLKQQNWRHALFIDTTLLYGFSLFFLPLGL